MIGLAQLDVGSPASYLIAVLVPALDALIPVLPSETAVIALGVATAGSADPRIAVLVALAAFGAFLGDNAAYLLGRRFGPAVSRRIFAGDRGARRRAWAQHSLDEYGIRLIVACRFIPGGRTAVTLTCGLIGYPRRSFILGTGLAGALWASYAFLIGRLGGQVFEGRPWAGLLVGLALSLVVSGVIEVARRLRRRRTRPAAAPHPGPQPDPGPGQASADPADSAVTMSVTGSMSLRSRVNPGRPDRGRLARAAAPGPARAAPRCPGRPPARRPGRAAG